MVRHSEAKFVLALATCILAVWQAGGCAIDQLPNDGAKGSESQTDGEAVFEGRSAKEWFDAVSSRTAEYGYACLALQAMGKSALPAICPAMSHKDVQVRQEAAQLLEDLADLGVWNEASVSELRAALSDPDALMRMYAVEGLSRSQSWVADDVPMLIKLLQNPTELDGTLWAGYGALGSLGQRSPEVVVPALIGVLREGTLWDKRHAACALGLIGPKAAPAVPALIETLKDVADAALKSAWIDDTSEEYVAGEAAVALGRIGAASKGAVPQLEGLTRGGPRRLRARAHYAIAKITGHTRPQVEAMIRILQSHAPDRFEAAEMLGELSAEPDLAVPALIAALKDSDTRHGAVTGLAGFKGNAKAAVPALVALLDDNEMEFPLGVALTLASISNERAVVKALELHLNDENFFTKYGCLTALAVLAPASREAHDLVEALTRSEDRELRLQALLALKCGQMRRKFLEINNQP